MVTTRVRLLFFDPLQCRSKNRRSLVTKCLNDWEECFGIGKHKEFRQMATWTEGQVRRFGIKGRNRRDEKV